MPNSSVAPWTWPPLTPPPASHIEKPRLLWSRPLAPSRRRRAAELAAPDDQRVVEQAARFQIVQQARRSGWSLLLGVVAVVGDVAVIVPRLAVAVVDLHHAHAALDQPAGDQAGVGELARRRRAAASPAVSRAEVERLLRLELHAEGHLQRRDAGFELLVAAALLPGASRFSCCSRSSCSRWAARRQVAVVDVADDRLRVDRLCC